MRNLKTYILAYFLCSLRKFFLKKIDSVDKSLNKSLATYFCKADFDSEKIASNC